jgi:hypothetical protein
VRLGPGLWSEVAATISDVAQAWVSLTVQDASLAPVPSSLAKTVHERVSERERVCAFVLLRMRACVHSTLPQRVPG